MHLKYRNVNDAFRSLVEAAHTGKFINPDTHMEEGVCLTNVVPTRNGECWRVEEPVTLSFTQPMERLLVNQARDANPFFHLYEALWMLDGRNDVASLQHYVSTFGDYSDDGQVIHDAYGYRWRHLVSVYAPSHHAIVWQVLTDAGASPEAFERVGLNIAEEPDCEDSDPDQLGMLIRHLEENPWSRRAVLQMWDADEDLVRMDQLPQCKAVPCNLSCVFEIEDEQFLNMTVFNRSNDLVWGMLGANYFHFSMLMEYMACALGVEPGTMHQVTTNMHAYTERWDGEALHNDITRDPYATHKNARMDWEPLFNSPSDRPVWDAECAKAVAGFSVRVLKNTKPSAAAEVTEVGRRESIDQTASASVKLMTGWDPQQPFFRDVVKPVLLAWQYHKLRNYKQAHAWIAQCTQAPWRMVCDAWLRKRYEAWVMSLKPTSLREPDPHTFVDGPQ